MQVHMYAATYMLSITPSTNQKVTFEVVLGPLFQALTIKYYFFLRVELVRMLGSGMRVDYIPS